MDEHQWKEGQGGMFTCYRYVTPRSHSSSGIDIMLTGLGLASKRLTMSSRSLLDLAIPGAGEAGGVISRECVWSKLCGSLTSSERVVSDSCPSDCVGTASSATEAP